MDYEAFFTGELDALKGEGRYRIFAELERRRGAYPRAKQHVETGTRDVTVWCLEKVNRVIIG